MEKVLLARRTKKTRQRVHMYTMLTRPWTVIVSLASVLVASIAWMVAEMVLAMYGTVNWALVSPIGHIARKLDERAMLRT